jgi:hypothetical protein
MPIKNYPKIFGIAKVMEFNKYKNFAAIIFYASVKQFFFDPRGPSGK